MKKLQLWLEDYKMRYGIRRLVSSNILLKKRKNFLLHDVLTHNLDWDIGVHQEQLAYLIETSDLSAKNTEDLTPLECAMKHHRVQNYFFTPEAWARLYVGSKISDSGYILGLMLDNYDNNIVFGPEIMHYLLQTSDYKAKPELVQKIIEKLPLQDISYMLSQSDLNYTDSNGWNTLMYALHFKRPELGYCIDNSDLSHINKNGWDALLFALHSDCTLTATQWHKLIRASKCLQKVTRMKTAFQLALNHSNITPEDLHYIAQDVLAGGESYFMTTMSLTVEQLKYILPSPHRAKLLIHAIDHLPEAVAILESYDRI